MAEATDISLQERADVTADELERMSLPFPAELYDGAVVYKRANYAHGKLQTRIATRLETYLQDNPVGDALSETNFRLWPDRPRESRIPDVALVRRERAPRDPHRFPALAPDLAVEIVSPEDSLVEMTNKVEEYLEQGTQLVWLVIPSTREILVCTAEGKQSVRDLLTAPDLLPGFELPVAEVFEGLPAATSSPGP